MMFSLMAAASENNVIGKDGGIPWHLPAEWRYMRATTMGKPAIMGRKTYDSIRALGRAPLPGRHNIIISRNPDLHFPGADVVSSVDEALELAKRDDHDEAFVYGGEEVYKAALPYADRIYLTRVHTTIDDGDAFFPEFDQKEWSLIKSERHEPDAENTIAFTTMVFERRLQD